MFDQCAAVGLLGSYSIGPDGGLAIFFLRRARCTLRRVCPVPPSEATVKPPALCAVGSKKRRLHRRRACPRGIFIHSYAAAFSLYSNGWFNQPWLATSKLSEDTIMALLTRAAGYRIVDFGGPADPMALRWRGLPARPARASCQEKAGNAFRPLMGRSYRAADTDSFRRSAACRAEVAVAVRIYNVISPHLDDAALSCSLFLAANTRFTCTTNADMVSCVRAAAVPSLPAARYFADGADVMRTRREEDHRAAALRPGNGGSLPYWDRQYRNNQQYGYQGYAEKELFDAVAEDLLRHGPDPTIDGWVIPLGLGHPDHRLAADVGLLLTEDVPRQVFSLPGAPVRGRGYRRCCGPERTSCPARFCSGRGRDA